MKNVVIIFLTALVIGMCLVLFGCDNKPSRAKSTPAKAYSPSRTPTRPAKAQTAVRPTQSRVQSQKASKQAAARSAAKPAYSPKGVNNGSAYNRSNTAGSTKAVSKPSYSSGSKPVAKPSVNRSIPGKPESSAANR